MYIPYLYKIAISGYILYSKLTTHIYKTYNKSLKVYNIFFPPAYIFYKGYTQPVEYRIESCNHMNLLYDTELSLFFPNILYDNTLKKHSLPLLSMDIRDTSDNIIYDLTNFIEDIRYIDIADAVKPSISSILMIWCTLKNVYPDPTLHQVRYIDNVGTMYQTHFNNLTELTRE